MPFNVVESIVILVYFIIVTLFGVFANRRITDSISYYLADRGLGVVFAGIGRFAAVASSFTFMGALGLGYTFGFPYLLSVAVGLNMGFVMSLLLLSNIRNSNAISIADFLAKRFDSKTLRVVASIISILVMFPAIVAQIRGAGIVGNSVLGIPFGLAMVLLTAVFVFYVFMGGLWAVTWTDMLQGIMLTVFLVIPSVFVAFTLGSDITTRALENAPSFLTGNLPMWSHLGITITFMGSMMTFPAYLFWSFTTKDVRILRKSVAVTAFMGVLVFSSYFFLLAGAHTVAPNLENPDNAFFTVAQFLFDSSPIVLGIIAAAALSAIMSSTDAMLLSTSAIVSNDLLKLIRPNSKDFLKIGRLSTLIIAAVALLFSFYTPALIGELIAAGAASAGSAFVFPLVLGVWWKRMNAQGAIAGVITGYLTYNILTFSNIVPIMNVPILISIPASAVACIVVAILTSPPNQKQQEFFESLHSASENITEPSMDMTNVGNKG
ncbi:sodium:solute symporter family protein [Virgibacillus kimchii]